MQNTNGDVIESVSGIYHDGREMMYSFNGGKQFVVLKNKKISELHDFKGNPFKVANDMELFELMRSCYCRLLLSENRRELLSTHYRNYCRLRLVCHLSRFSVYSSPFISLIAVAIVMASAIFNCLDRRSVFQNISV